MEIIGIILSVILGISVGIPVLFGVIYIIGTAWMMIFDTVRAFFEYEYRKGK